MLLIGLLLIVAAVVMGSAVVLDANESTSLGTLGGTWDTTNAGVFLAGAATMLTLLLGVWLLQLGLSRSRRRRREVKGLKRENKSLAQVEEEKAALAAELEQERARRVPTSGGSRAASPRSERDTGRTPASAHDQGGSPLRSADDVGAREATPGDEFNDTKAGERRP